MVVDSIGFNGKQWLDFVGHPLSPTTHIVERWYMKDKNTLEVDYRHRDAAYLLSAARAVLGKTERIHRAVCVRPLENHRRLSRTRLFTCTRGPLRDELVGKGVSGAKLPPDPMRITRFTRAGASRATFNVTDPPRELPMKFACSIPSASSRWMIAPAHQPGNRLPRGFSSDCPESGEIRDDHTKMVGQYGDIAVPVRPAGSTNLLK